MTADLGGLRAEEVREALRLLGVHDAPASTALALRRLRDLLAGYGTVRGVLDAGPTAARVAFERLAGEGALPVEDLLGRGWWGRGTLPPPLDWLQKRALVLVGDDGRVHAADEARRGFLDLTLGLPPAGLDEDARGLRVEAVGTVVIATEPSQLDRALGVSAAALRSVAPTVAVSSKPAPVVTRALHGAGIRLVDDVEVVARPAAPALPGTAEDAVGPKAVRQLLQRALEESRQVRLEYYASSRGGQATDRVVDPWAFADDLLRGYCHLRSGERTFAVDRIGRAHLLPTPIEHAEV